MQTQLFLLRRYSKDMFTSKNNIEFL